MFNRALLTSILVSCWPGPASADVISDWKLKGPSAFVTNAEMAPPQAERVMAMVHVAMFDAVNAIDQAAIGPTWFTNRRRPRRPRRRQPLPSPQGESSSASTPKPRQSLRSGLGGLSRGYP